MKVEVPIEVARRTLLEFETQIAAKINSRYELAIEIGQLEDGAKSLRSELKNSLGQQRQSRGSNRAKIKEYLGKLPGNRGSKASEITKATGIGPSSTAFTLRNYSKDFVLDDNQKLWKLNHIQP